MHDSSRSSWSSLSWTFPARNWLMLDCHTLLQRERGGSRRCTACSRRSVLCYFMERIVETACCSGKLGRQLAPATIG